MLVVRSLSSICVRVRELKAELNWEAAGMPAVCKLKEMGAVMPESKPIVHIPFRDECGMLRAPTEFAMDKRELCKL